MEASTLDLGASRNSELFSLRITVLLFFLASFCAAAPYPYDYVCNNQTDYMCVCYQGNQDTRGLIPDCYSLMRGPNLTVVKVVAKNLDLEEDITTQKYKIGAEGPEKLYIREPMESNFRKHVARIVGMGCGKNANLCPGVGQKVSPDQVALVRARCGAPNETEILLTVLNESEKPFVAMRSDNTLNASVILQFFAEQSSMLNRSLGSAKIVDMGVETITLKRPKKKGGGGFEETFRKNKKMIVMLAIIGGFLVIVYIIAIFKVIRDTRRKRAQEKSLNQVKAKNYGATSNKIPPPAPPPVPRPTQIIGKSKSNLKNSDSANSNRVAPAEKRSSIPKSLSNHSNNKVAVVEVEPQRAAPEPPQPPATLSFKEDSPSPASPSESSSSRPPSKSPSLERDAPSLPPILFQPENSAYESIRLPVLTTSLRKAISSTSCHKINEEPESKESSAEGGPSHSSSSDTKMSESAAAIPRSASASLNQSDSKPHAEEIPTEAVEPAANDDDDSTIGSGSDDEEGLSPSAYQALSPAGSIPDFIKDLEEAQNDPPDSDFGSFPGNGAFSGLSVPRAEPTPSRSFGNASALPSVSINVEEPPEDPELDSDTEDRQTSSPPPAPPENGLVGTEKPDLRGSQQCLVNSDDDDEGDEEAGSSEEEDSSLKMNGMSQEPNEDEDEEKETMRPKPKSAAKRRRRRDGAFGRDRADSTGETTSSGSLSSLASRNSALGIMDYERLAESGWSLNTPDVPPPLPTSEPPAMDQLEKSKPHAKIISIDSREEDSSSPDLR